MRESCGETLPQIQSHQVCGMDVSAFGNMSVWNCVLTCNITAYANVHTCTMYLSGKIPLLSYRTEQQWRDLAYCLSHINFTERCVRKLQDNFQCFQDKLVDREVYSSFTSITNKAKKFAKPETKVGIYKFI